MIVTEETARELRDQIRRVADALEKVLAGNVHERPAASAKDCRCPAGFICPVGNSTAMCPRWFVAPASAESWSPF